MISRHDYHHQLWALGQRQASAADFNTGVSRVIAIRYQRKYQKFPENVVNHRHAVVAFHHPQKAHTLKVRRFSPAAQAMLLTHQAF